MRAQHVNPFIDSVKLVFETMLGTQVAIAKPRIKTDDQPSYDVTGIIALSGEAVGSVAVSFPMDTAIKCVEAFSGMPVEEPDDNFTDAIGELANMIAGNAKKDLENLKVNISVPTVIVGQGHRLGRHQLGPWIVLECTSPHGPFNLEMCVVEVAAAVAGGA